MKTIFLLFLLFVLSSAATRAQTSTFTYQGKLSDASMAASGTYDFEFALYDGAGTQINSTQTKTGVTVTNGVFTVQLDFTAAAFPGADRFLEIRVKRPADTNYTTLTPRQPVTSTPYANRALNATNADNATNATMATNAQQLGGVAASQFTQNDSQAFIRNQTTQQTADFNVSGTGAANIFNAATQYNINGNRILSNAGSGNLFAGAGAGMNNTGSFNSFVGANAGISNTTGGNNSFVGALAGVSNSTGFNNSFVGAFAGFSNATGVQNSFVGYNAGVNNTTGGSNSFFGRNAGQANTTGGNNTIIGQNANVGADNLTYATAIGSDAIVSTSNTVVLGRTADTVIAPNLLQVNTLGAAGSTSLCRNSSNQISTCTMGNRAEMNSAIAEKFDALGKQVKQQSELIKQQQFVIDGLKKLVCSQNPNADVCK